MSEDEVFALMIFGILAVGGWVTWFRAVATATTLGSSHAERATMYLTPLMCAVALLIVLRYFASFNVVDDFMYIFFYFVMGAGWVATGRAMVAFLGISPRDDAVERRNPAAGIAVAGAMLGITLCFAGGNIGDGPGWWVVVFSAILSTGTLLLLWWIIQKFTRISDAITIDRDLASALRLSGFLVGSGLILGRAVAGDWYSFGATVIDFVKFGWPATTLAGAEIILSRMFRPKPTHPTWPAVTCGVIPAAMYVAAASVYVMGVGQW